MPLWKHLPMCFFKQGQTNIAHIKRCPVGACGFHEAPLLLRHGDMEVRLGWQPFVLAQVLPEHVYYILQYYILQYTIYNIHTYISIYSDMLNPKMCTGLLHVNMFTWLSLEHQYSLSSFSQHARKLARSKFDNMSLVVETIAIHGNLGKLVQIPKLECYVKLILLKKQVRTPAFLGFSGKPFPIVLIY
jgi:hypothetical protein